MDGAEVIHVHVQRALEGRRLRPYHRDGALGAVHNASDPLSRLRSSPSSPGSGRAQRARSSPRANVDPPAAQVELRIGGANGPAELKKMQIVQARLRCVRGFPSGPPNAWKIPQIR
jgi:hypothetical protein